ncbi:ABC transporter permease [bacterium 0.1xD8-71]|nr:ABC transporter permease [bacterium 0.1xD8-71]
MWKTYSAGYIKQNRAICASVRVAAFIAALFLAFLCGLFYHFWQDDVAGVIEEEGAWHGRITGEFDEEDISMISSLPHVENVYVNEVLSGEDGMVVDIIFHPVRSILTDMPAIAAALGLEEEAVSYHYQLLSLYFVRIPGDEQPRLVMPFYLAIIVAVCVSMVLVIYNAFVFTMNTRVHQFGIFASVGATPMQIRICLLQEATAWMPARKMSRMTPLEAIRGSGEMQPVKKKHSPILSFLFGIEGELAGNALKAQKRAFRTSTLSLTLSFMGFMLMQCFFTLSDISTEETYFARYQDVWDIMVTVQNTGIDKIRKNDVATLRELPGVEDVAVYQKAEAVCKMPVTGLSGELTALGGLEALTKGQVIPTEGFLLAEAPVIVLDDESFGQYYGESAEGSIVINRVWDSLHSHFRERAYIPFVQEGQDTLMLCAKQDKGTAVVPVLAYTQEPPVLREEYADYGLVQIMPCSYWEQIKEQIGGAGQDTYIRILVDENLSLAELTELEQKAGQILGGASYAVESENRLQEKFTNNEMIAGYRFVLGGFCILLAVIGVANVFSNTLGFLRLRKREVARYLSVGLTPGGVGRVFALEALVIAGRPVLITVPLVSILTWMMIKASYLQPIVFIKRAPIGPIMIFVLFIFGSVASAYYLGGRKVLRNNISEELRNDMV